MSGLAQVDPQFSERYQQLRRELAALHAQPVKDMAAIDAVIQALEAEQLHLKAHDGQHGNNPIEGRRPEFDNR